MARTDFVAQLRELGYEVSEIVPRRIVFPYTIESGKFVGQEIRLGFEVPADFGLTPPGGVHVSPRLLPIHPGGAHPSGGINDSPNFGIEWEYWSRPLAHWNQTDRSAKAVMAHVRHLFDTQ